MSIYDDKNTLKYAVGKISKHIENWDPRYTIFEIKPEQEIPDLWCVLLITSTKRFIVTDVEEELLKLKFTKSSKIEFIKHVENFEDVNYKIYYKSIEQKLIGYLLDFFIYYVEMPDKIITDIDDNNELYERIKKQIPKLSNKSKTNKQK